MIKFHCENCGQRFKVSDTSAGKKGRCPKCKSIVVVPEIQTPSSSVQQKDSGDLKVSSINSAYDLNILDVPQKERVQDESMNQYKVEEGIETTETELADKRKLPWIVDIFLYPTSTPGLTNLGIFIIVPLLFRIMGLLLGPFAVILEIPGIIINTLISLYMCWYLAECVRDSAFGGTRAPEAFAIVEIGEMFWQTLQLAGCYLVFWGPLGFYFLYFNKIDTIFWVLLAYGISFFPMGLLAVVMFKSDSALNPILLIRSIFITFFQYCGLVLMLGAVALVIYAVNKIQLDNWFARVLDFFIYSGQIYLALVVAHLLGRFYWMYQEKLNWEV